MATAPDRCRRSLLLLGVPGLWGASLLARANGVGTIFVVVSAQSPVRSMSQKEVLAIYTGRMRLLPNGERAEPLDQRHDGAVRAAFYRKLAGMDLALINTYWARLHFSAKVQPPLAVADDPAVLERVRGNPATIGYLTHEPTDAGVRVVLRLP